MILKKIFYFVMISLSLYTLTWSIDNVDVSGEHPRVLPEDLFNLDDEDLELKDTDQLKLLLSDIDGSLNDDRNDFEGEFNVPEITDHMENYRFSYRNGRPLSGGKIADLTALKREVEALLALRAQQEPNLD